MPPNPIIPASVPAPAPPMPIMWRLLEDRVRPLAPRPGIPMLGSFCSSFHLTPPSDWSAEESSLLLAKSWREEDLLTRLENLPLPVDLPFLLSVDDAGSTEVSWTKYLRLSSAARIIVYLGHEVHFFKISSGRLCSVPLLLRIDSRILWILLLLRCKVLLQLLLLLGVLLLLLDMLRVLLLMLRILLVLWILARA